MKQLYLEEREMPCQTYWVIARVIEGGFQSWKEAMEWGKLERIKPAKTKPQQLGTYSYLIYAMGFGQLCVLICF